MIRAYLRAGLDAARANLIPALILQAAMAALLIGWFVSPAVRELLGHLAEFKIAAGYLYSAVTTAFAAAVLPEGLKILTLQRGRVTRENLRMLAFGLPFWAWLGVVVDAFYRVQSAVFGNVTDFGTVASKLLVDVLGFTPLIGVPSCVVAYAWMHSGYRREVLRKAFTLRFYRDRILPVLIPNWALWTPIMVVVYAMPPGLQIPIFVVALACWTLILTTLTLAHARQADAHGST
jgi:hypothetical protein